MIAQAGDAHIDRLPAVLLNELRNLFDSSPDDALSRRELAWALYNCYVFADRDRDRQQSDALFRELMALAGRFEADAEIRVPAAKLLFNRTYDAGQQGDKPAEDALLATLQNLYLAGASAVDADAGAATPRADAGSQGEDFGDLTAGPDVDLAIDALLRAQARVRDDYTGALINALIYAQNDRDAGRRDRLLISLREIALANPTDTNSQLRLA